LRGDEGLTVSGCAVAAALGSIETTASGAGAGTGSAWGFLTQLAERRSAPPRRARDSKEDWDLDMIWIPVVDGRRGRLQDKNNPVAMVLQGG